MEFSGGQTVLIGICFFILGVVGTILAVRSPYDYFEDAVDHVTVYMTLKCKYCDDELDFTPTKEKVSPGQLDISLKVDPCRTCAPDDLEEKEV